MNTLGVQDLVVEIGVEHRLRPLESRDERRFASWPILGFRLLAPLGRNDNQPARATLYTRTSAVGRNLGGLLNFVACSNEYASLMSTGSLHARPKKEIPTGRPKTNPAGTVTLG